MWYEIGCFYFNILLLLFLLMTVAYPEMERVLVVNTAQLHLTLSKRKVIVMWYDLYNFKKVLLVLLLVKLHTFLTLLHGCFSCILNCTNGTKLRKTSHMLVHILHSVYQNFSIMRTWARMEMKLNKVSSVNSLIKTIQIHHQ